MYSERNHEIKDMFRKSLQKICTICPSFYKENKEQELVDNILRDKDKFFWDKIVEVIEEFLGEVFLTSTMV